MDSTVNPRNVNPHFQDPEAFGLDMSAPWTHEETR